MKFKIIGGVLATLVVYGILSYLGLVPGMTRTASVVPTAISLAEGDNDAAATGVTAVALPGSGLTKLNKPVVRFEIIPWTALHGLLFSNGGPQTTVGSLQEKHGVKLALVRQDNVDKMRENHALFATALAGGTANPSTGPHFVVIMGDGAGTYLGLLNKTLEPLGPDYRAEIVGAVGYSRGEDAYWGPAEWKDNPESQKGGLTAGYLRDGDWNLAQFKLANDGIKNNPDETTWDPDAMNWVSTPDFLDAVQKYVTGYCEERKVVRNGKVSATEKKKVCVQGVATWTPGDVNLAQQKGGLVKLISTKENAYQMPATVIGIHAWNVKNAKLVEEMLAAAFEGGDQIKAYKEALSKAATIAVNVYKEQKPAYWRKYYEGSREEDKTGALVELGGSKVMNLADNLFLFGEADGTGGISGSAYNASYTGFASMVQTQYPALLPWFPPVELAVNTQFIKSLASKGVLLTDNAETTTFEDNDKEISSESVVAKRDWTINFETGKATFTPQAEATLTQLYNQLLIGGGLAVEIAGHTDNTGNPAANQVLSAARANAVKAYLEQRAPALFSKGRVVTRGYGDTKPIADNITPAGKAKNRRVTVVLGTQD